MESTPAADQVKAPTKTQWLKEIVPLATLVVAVLALVAQQIQFWVFTRPTLVKDDEHKGLVVNVAKSESLSILGQVESPELYIVDNREAIPVCPVFIEMTNTGMTPVQIKSIEFRVLIAPLRSVSKLALPDPGLDTSIVLTSGTARGDGSSTTQTPIGIIDPESAAWTEKAELSKRIEPTHGVIAPSQKRHERIHLLAPTECSFLTKVEVTVKTDRTTQKWYGFANPQLCRPSAMPPSVEE